VYGLAVGMVIEDTALLRSSMRQLLDWYSAGRLRILVGQKYPLREAAQAHRPLESRQSHGKIVLIP
jgi:NADPH2:quinone reductase